MNRLRELWELFKATVIGTTFNVLIVLISLGTVGLANLMPQPYRAILIWVTIIILSIIAPRGSPFAR